MMAADHEAPTPRRRRHGRPWALAVAVALAVTGTVGASEASVRAPAPPSALTSDQMRASLLTAPIVPDRWYMGVASHLGDARGRASDGKMIGEIALTELGAMSLRDEAFWSEMKRGEPHFTGKLAVVGQHGGKLLLILDYGNPDLQQGGPFPDSPGERQAFLEYANEAISRIGYQNLAGIEIWNEWNVYMGWGGKYRWGDPCPTDPTDAPGCPRMYAQLVETLLYPEREGLTLPSLRQTAPGVPVIVNAISARDPAWTSASMGYLRDRGVQVDGAAIHPYVAFHNGCPGTERPPSGPQVAARCVAVTAEDVARDYGQRLPMWVTEVGWSRAGTHAVSHETQAVYLVETYVRTRATGVTAGIWWYDLQDDLHPGSPEEAHYGLVGRDPSDVVRPGAVHPSGRAFAALARFWAGCASISGAYQQNRAFTLTCADETRQIILAATADELAAAAAGGGTLVDLLGERPHVPASGDVASLAGRPVGIAPPGATIEAVPEGLLSENPPTVEVPSSTTDETSTTTLGGRASSLVSALPGPNLAWLLGGGAVLLAAAGGLVAVLVRRRRRRGSSAAA
ncbi:MAG: hypothetical protein FWD18_07750 [Micrococcales bacterium]|nr:hypothetical protein [Micrococcales bacterium]